MIPIAGLVALAACDRGDAGVPTQADAHAGHTTPGASEAPADPHAGHGTALAAAAPSPVTTRPEVAAAIGVRTVAARAGTTAPLYRAPATATFDPAGTRRVTVSAGGLLREDRVPRIGEGVRAGQVLARLWLPEVSAAFEELYVARPLGEPWASASRNRLLALGVPAADIDAAGQTVPETWTVRAPVSGVVVSRPARVGGWLGPGGVIAEIAPGDARVVEMVTAHPPATGTPVTLTDGAETWAATVSEVLPTAGPAGRSVRLLPRGNIAVGRPLIATWHGPESAGIWVPRGAVVDTGARQLVFVAGGDTYTPRSVTLGVRTSDEVQILGGLDAGEHVVAAGTFLFDSETQMQGGGGGHAGHGG